MYLFPEPSNIVRRVTSREHLGWETSAIPLRSVILRPAKERRDIIWKLLFLMYKGFLLTGF